MVVDIGGGTTEVAVISLSAVAYAESIRVAGDEMNEAIQRYIQDQYSVLVGENAAERIKIEIGSAVDLKDGHSVRVSGKNMVNGTPKAIEINSGQVRESIQEPLNAIVMAVRKALEKTPPELITDVGDNGLLLTGGGSLLRGMDKLIQDRCGVRAAIEEEPLTTVLRGTGYAMRQEKYFDEMFVN
jgi:rod shape-determining protein MreB